MTSFLVISSTLFPRGENATESILRPGEVRGGSARPPVPIKECRRCLFLTQIHNRSGILVLRLQLHLDAISEQLSTSALPSTTIMRRNREHWSCGYFFFANRTNLFNPHCLADIIEQLVAVYGPFLKTLEKELLCPLDNFFPFADSDVLDRFNDDMGNARSHTVNCFE